MDNGEESRRITVGSSMRCFGCYVPGHLGATCRRKPYQSAPPCRRGKGRKSGDVENKRGLNTKIHLAVDANGMPVRIVVTEGTRADCKEAVHLMRGSPRKPCWPIGAMIQMKFWPMPFRLVWNPSSRPKRTVRSPVNTTNISIGCDIWLKIVSSL